MIQIRKIINSIPKVGDRVKCVNSIFRDDLDIYICHIEEDILFISPDKDATKDSCETKFVEDCYLVDLNLFDINVLYEERKDWYLKNQYSEYDADNLPPFIQLKLDTDLTRDIQVLKWLTEK